MLRAVDVQQILIQSSAVDKVQQAQPHHDTQQKYLALHLIEERKLLQERVTNAEESERALLRDKEEQRRRKKMAPEKPPSGAGSSGEGAVSISPEEQGEYIDIRV